jgi:hypothetical protein
VGTGVAATIRAVVIRGPVCVDAVEAGALTIDGSDLASPLTSTCAHLSAQTTLRRSTVRRTAGLSTATPPASVVTAGLVEDTHIEDGLELDGKAAVARRVEASGWTAIAGDGLVVDSVARAVGSDGAAITADALGGGTLRVVNATAFAAQAPALVARPTRTDMGPASPNVLQVSNTIARGAPSDIVAMVPAVCRIGQPCISGEIEIDHSNFAVRDPAMSSTRGGGITEGEDNQSADPRFVNADTGDLDLRPGSPAIDAGAALADALPLDLDRRPRLQGPAIDLGAYEAAAPNGTRTGASSSRSLIDLTAPILGRLRLAHRRFRVGAHGGTTVRTTTSEAGRVTFAVQRLVAGHRSHGRCVAHGGRKAARCVRWVARKPALVRRAGSPGTVTLAFSGRIGGRALAPGRYRFVVSARDAAGNVSKPRTASFTVMR